MLKNTPGPWSYKIHGATNSPMITAAGLNIAVLFRTTIHPSDEDQSLANARLIAAAPDLLEAAKEACRALWNTAEVERSEGREDGTFNKAWTALSAAVLKAQGR